MLRFTEGKLVAHILGNHIEQTRTPYLDYPVFKRTQKQQLDHMWDQSQP
jgi:hypothetical protein